MIILLLAKIINRVTVKIWNLGKLIKIFIGRRRSLTIISLYNKLTQIVIHSTLKHYLLNLKTSMIHNIKIIKNNLRHGEYQDKNQVKN